MDPKPFVRTFEQVLEELQQLRIRVQHQCDELEAGTQKAEQHYKKTIINMQDAFKVKSKQSGVDTRHSFLSIVCRKCISLMMDWKIG
jgi:hypothetical protein